MSVMYSNDHKDVGNRMMLLYGCFLCDKFMSIVYTAIVASCLCFTFKINVVYLLYN